MKPLRVALILGLLACSKPQPEVVVYTTVPRALAEPALRAAAHKLGRNIAIVFGGDEIYGRLLAESGRPRADLLWAADGVRPQALAQRGLVTDHAPGPVQRARVLLVARGSGATPRSLTDLVDPRWKGRVAIPDPSKGIAAVHMAAIAARWGDGRARRFLRALRANDARVARDDAEVRRLVVAGQVAFGLTNSDEARAAAADTVIPDVAAGGTFVAKSQLLLLKGAPHAAIALQVMKALGGPPPPGDLRALQVDDAEVARALQRLQPALRAFAPR